MNSKHIGSMFTIYFRDICDSKKLGFVFWKYRALEISIRWDGRDGLKKGW